MGQLICKCCGKEARWCGEGENACGTQGCDHIHCDHCGMHYSLELIPGAENSETHERARELMLAAYNPAISGSPLGLSSSEAATLSELLYFNKGKIR